MVAKSNADTGGRTKCARTNDRFAPGNYWCPIVISRKLRARETISKNGFMRSSPCK